MERTLDIRYNYLIDGELPLPGNFDWKNRTDPDSGCKKLYDDIILAYFSNLEQNQSNGIISVENWEQKYGGMPPFYTIRINSATDCVLLSSDYIGPSVHWANEQGISDEKITEFLSVCRTIGGHMVWPRGRDITYDGTQTINCARAGNRGVYDRIDWTLLLIKMFYDCEGESEFLSKLELIFSDEIHKYNCKSNLNRMYNSIKRTYAVWLCKFPDFTSFCKQFCLERSFVDRDYNVIKMADWIPLLPNSYADFINNLCKAVQIRNNFIISKS